MANNVNIINSIIASERASGALSNDTAVEARRAALSKMTDAQLSTLLANTKAASKPNFITSWLNTSTDNTPVPTLSVFGCNTSPSVSNPYTIERTTPQAQTSNSSAAENPAEVEAKQYTINSLGTSVYSAIKSFVPFAENEGAVSKGYNSLKEFFDAELSKSSVARELYSERNGVCLLDKANEGTLTKQEYYDSKVQLLMDMLPNAKTMSAEDKAILEGKFREFSPEKVNNFIKTVSTCSATDYEKLGKKNDALINQEKKSSNSSVEGSSNQINSPSKTSKAYKLSGAQDKMTFEETFLAERGTIYDKKDIEQFKNQEGQLSFVSSVQARKDAVHQLLDSDVALVKGNNEGAVDSATANISNSKLEDSLAKAMKELYGDDPQKIDAKLKELCGNNLVSYESGKIKFDELAKGIKSGSLVTISEKLLNQTDENYKKIMGGKSLDSYQKDYANTYVKAYGTKEPKNLAEAYSKDQEGSVQTLKAGLQYGGMIVAVGGMLVPGPGWVATAGILTSTFGGVAVSAVNEGSREGGMTPEVKAGLVKELATNTAFLAAGFAGGGAGMAAKEALLLENCPKLIACASDYGVQAATGVLSELVLTGQVNLTGQGLMQIPALVAGIVAHKKMAGMKSEVAPEGARINGDNRPEILNDKPSEASNPFGEKTGAKAEAPQTEVQRVETPSTETVNPFANNVKAEVKVASANEFKSIKQNTDGSFNIKMGNEEINIPANGKYGEKDIVDLASNTRLGTEDLSSLLEIIKKNPESKNDILNLSSIKHFDLKSIEKTLKDFEKYPEFREIMFNPNKPTPDFITDEAPSQNVLNNRKQIVNNLSKIADKSKIKTLQKALEDKFYNIKWEKVIPEGATPQEANKILGDLVDRTSMFVRIKCIEKKNGLNANWATEMREVADKASVRILDGASSRDVIDNIADDAHNYVAANGRENDQVCNDAEHNVGVPRKESNATTAYGGSDEYYQEYAKKFANSDKKRISPYADMEITEVTRISAGGIMCHPYAEKSVEAGFKHIDEKYSELQPLIQKKKNGEKLTPAEEKIAKTKIAEMHYILANVMPYKRGSAGIADVYTRSLYESLGMELPPLKRGIGLDLEAFYLNMDEYTRKWDSFFEK